MNSAPRWRTKYNLIYLPEGSGRVVSLEHTDELQNARVVMQEQTYKFGSSNSQLVVLIVQTVEKTGHLLRIETRIDGQLMAGILQKQTNSTDIYCVRFRISFINLLIPWSLSPRCSISISINYILQSQTNNQILACSTFSLLLTSLWSVHLFLYIHLNSTYSRSTSNSLSRGNSDL